MKYYLISIICPDRVAEYFLRLEDTQGIDKFIDPINRVVDSVMMPVVKDSGTLIPRLISIGNPFIVSQLSDEAAMPDFIWDKLNQTEEEEE